MSEGQSGSDDQVYNRQIRQVDSSEGCDAWS